MSSNVRWRRAVAGAVFSALSATSAFAQAGGVGVIEGTVKDGQSGRPIEGVQVAVLDQLAPGPADRPGIISSGPGPVADVGCGPGHVTAFLKNHGLDVFGVDLSPGMIAQARAAHPELRFDIGSMTDFDQP